MNGQLEAHLQNIEDFIQIDDKIVTYKWISKVLKVHTNTAKQLLFAYSKKPEVSDKLLVTYIVAGEQQDGKGLNFQLVREKDLEETKKAFLKITSTHVYSIQRGAAVSGADIYNADSSYKLTPEDHKFCSIQNEGKIDRREMKVVIPPTTQENNSVSSKTVPKKATEPVSRDTKLSTQKGAEPLKTKDVPPNKEETEEKPQPPKKTSPKKNDKKTAPAKSGNIGALFMKQAAKKKDDSSIKAEVKKVNEDKDVKDAEKLSDKTTVSEVKTPTANKSVGKKKRKKPKDSKDSAAKRRKRIQVASDSESSDQESDGNERFPSPEPEPEAPKVVESEEEEEIIPSTPLEKGRKRVRKLVDRTYEDEEGYIITKKEYVVESCSDNESTEPPVKKNDVETTNEETKTNGAHEDEESTKKRRNCAFQNSKNQTRTS
uniref:DNA polymerase delta subunit 3 n=1 Tax=Lygus hesperus TaxID=30085 RepID=A0A146KPK0_LYGHE